VHHEKENTGKGYINASRHILFVLIAPRRSNPNDLTLDHFPERTNGVNTPWSLCRKKRNGGKG
jgi:hypothetical protein